METPNLNKALGYGRFLTKDADFEEKHPREKGGKFGPKGGGEASGKKEEGGEAGKKAGPTAADIGKPIGDLKPEMQHRILRMIGRQWGYIAEDFLRLGRATARDAAYQTLDYLDRDNDKDALAAFGKLKGDQKLEIARRAAKLNYVTV